jgi:hypothetical protein
LTFTSAQRLDRRRLTTRPPLHTLGMVHRFGTILLGLVLASTSGQVSALHIHAYTDHDHPEHHHGPASHEHHRSAPDQDVDGPHLESCDPAQHALSLTMGCAPLQQVPVLDAESASPSTLEPLIPIRAVHDLTDVRVHGPPPRTHAPPRAPPLTSPA